MNVVGPKACLDVSHRDAFIEGGKGGGEARRRVAVDEHQRWPPLTQDVANTHHYRRRQFGEPLALSHHVEIEIRSDLEQREYLIEHFAVLRSDAHLHDELLPPM